MFQYYFKYHDTVSYHDIFGSVTQYYYLVVSHISMFNIIMFSHNQSQFLLVHENVYPVYVCICITVYSISIDYVQNIYIKHAPNIMIINKPAYTYVVSV